MIRFKEDKNNFRAIFDTETGMYVRSGILDANGKDTGVDPFMAEMPELLDIGVMGSCQHGLSGKCIKSSVQCYQNGLNTQKEHMTLDDFKRIVDQTKDSCFQYALGGRGDVNKHPEFEEILKYCRKNDIVPNYTTSGLDLTDEEVEITKKYCGAVAVSDYEQDYTKDALDMFLDAEITTNVHYVLSEKSILRAYNMLKGSLLVDNKPYHSNLNAIIFLLHKPVGLGSSDNVIKPDHALLKPFIKTIENPKLKVQIGFDSCTIPGLVNYAQNIDLKSVDTCEGGRFSAYVTSDMKMLPCSFDNQDERWAVDLNKYTVKEAWNSSKFDDFRSRMMKACPECMDQEHCMGGCPIVPEIVLCDRPEKELVK